MIRKAHISIPTPCHENWHEMAVADKHRFCASCAKHVIDFTTATDREILRYFESHENVCGRFLKSQLSRELQQPKPKYAAWIAAVSGIIALLNPNNTAKAQVKNETVQTTPRFEKKTESNQTYAPEKLFSGTVSDATGTLPSAVVLIKGTGKSVLTDIDGYFEIMARENDTLVFSYFGLTSVELVILEQIKLDVTLKPAMGADEWVTVGGAMIAYQKPKLHKRVYYFFKRLFRKKQRFE